MPFLRSAKNRFVLHIAADYKNSYLLHCRDYITARGTTAVERYNVKVVRSTTYSLMYCGAGLGLSSTRMTSLNNATEKPLTLWSICAPTFNQV